MGYQKDFEMKELKDIGLLMTPANATAIREDRKGMMRQMQGLEIINSDPDIWTGYRKHVSRNCWTFYCGDGHSLETVKAPYTVGQRLYLNEPHYAFGLWVPDGLTKTGRPAWRFRYTALETVFYFADTLPKSIATNLKRNTDRKEGWYERPPLFMFKEFARTWLLVTEVKAPERVQSIDDADAIAEGALFGHDPSGKCNWADGFARACFCKLWDSIYGADKAKSWDANPWVWPSTFKKIEHAL